MGEVPGTRHVVLVHGVCHGAWCWYKIASLLKNSGFKVTAVDLGGAGINPKNADSIVSFEEYNKPLIDLILTIPEDEKIILVGHSAGGLSLTHATHVFGKSKISLCIYITAAMLRNGFKTDEDLQDCTLASMLLKPGPLMALLTAKFEGENSGEVDKVNRVYIKTTKDEVLKLENQELLIKKWPPNEVMSIDTDHSPFFSKPKELHNLLIKASTMYCD
ncbi:methylesterase 17-like isoform X2 [Amborella trichopoda]|uniref:methylesterase 17-like isoform X2 n=1 Tax=Amborella trichopoda TaxID=13333 RepID=UPI0009C0CA39|nr:methylesterase 17-like isoform X2 [Amborella trichopoda]|eukprot:XP_020522497.1 methylesterase 17-like isoform X2 [Amborella trichopoda]